ncbi:hypothetical protein ACA910_009275 [Epithemia clementina (nom. ined.)]
MMMMTPTAAACNAAKTAANATTRRSHSTATIGGNSTTTTTSAMLLRSLGRTTGRHDARHRFMVTGRKWRSPPAVHHSYQRMSISSVALTEEERTTALQTRLAQPGNPNPWKTDPNRNAICKRFLFTNFSQAWAFLSRSALLAEKMDHHPEWFNVYNMVDVTLTTHDCQGVSNKDIEMAQAMDEYSASILQQNIPSPPPSGAGTLS